MESSLFAGSIWRWGIGLVRARVLLTLPLLICFSAGCASSTDTQVLPEPVTQTNRIVSQKETDSSERPARERSEPRSATASRSQESRRIDDPPMLRNLALKKLGPYDPTRSMFGALKYDKRFPHLVFHEFGRLQLEGQQGEYHNPNFEFKAPADSVVIAPISGMISYLEWQPSQSYIQDDWEIHIKPSEHSLWGVGIDHVVSLACDRGESSTGTCELALTAQGEELGVGSPIEAGTPIGTVGNWQRDSDVGISGRTELTVFRYGDDMKTVVNHCPMSHIASDLEEELNSVIRNLMGSFETWAQDQSIYPQDTMVAPGCRYTAIEEDEQGRITPAVPQTAGS